MSLSARIVFAWGLGLVLTTTIYGQVAEISLKPQTRPAITLDTLPVMSSEKGGDSEKGADTVRTPELRFMLSAGAPGQAIAPSGASKVVGNAMGFSSNYAETLEWMAADSSLIVLATIQNGAGDEVFFAVKEVIKGNVAQTVMKLERKKDSPLPGAGTNVLLFLRENVGLHSERFPWKLRWRKGCIPLDGYFEFRIGLMDRSALSDPQKILAAVRDAARYNADPEKKPAVLACSTALGPRCMIAPIDHRLEALAVRWAQSRSVEDRILGMRALRYFKSEKHIPLLRGMLADTRSRTPRGSGKWQVGHYHVRFEAADLLAEWNEWRPDLTMGGPIYVYQPVGISRGWSIGLGAAALAVLGLTVFPWRGRSAFASWTLLILCLAAILSLSLLWVRSSKRVDEVMFTIGSEHHQVASYRGGINYMLVREWTPPTRTVYGNFDLAVLDDVWSLGALNPPSKRQTLGFTSASGNVVAAGSSVNPYGLFRVPYWALMIPFLLVLLRQALRVRQLLRRRRLGLCRKCGYNLRESPGGQCPECGNAQIAKKPAAALAPVLQAGNEMPIGG